MNEINPADGLHLVKRKFQKRFMRQQCTSLESCLPNAIAQTMALYDVREGAPYIVVRQERREGLTHPESQWEEALFWEMKDPPPASNAPWRQLLTYQVNLPNKKKANDWGEIDLLGVSHSGLPLIVELKAQNSSESPAQMLVQAAAYGVAICKAWPVRLRAEWAQFGLGGVTDAALPDELSGCELVCAAPAEYWRVWTGDTPRARRVSRQSWAALAHLRRSFERNGYRSVFVNLGHSAKGLSGVPTGITVREEHVPEGAPYKTE